MIGDRRILAVVPARGGSKGIPLKNLRPVLGVPMVARAGQVAGRLGWLDRAVVSTDHDEIARVAEAVGLAAPFRRPGALSGDRIGDLDVLIHALEEMERIDRVRYDVVVMLQPTSPLRRPEHVTATIERLIHGGWDAVWTVSETDSKAHPLKQLTVGEDGGLGYYDPAGKAIIARQQLSPVFHRNGIAYAITRDCLTGQRTIMGARTAALVIGGPTLSIDTEEDIALAEFLMRRHGDPAG
ncbi:MAG TPA: acylneuraminate cytidylyltransferase family protein [Thermohalobaculum sp.]|nr:acylneuraminate cytidylyltransferase family protein [Thermohalobaculum sp.]